MLRTKIKIGPAVIFILIIAIAIPAALWCKQYYDNRYALEDYYYAIVPLDYDFTPIKSNNSKGDHVGFVTRYNLLCFNADGKSRELEFKANPDIHALYPPGTFLKISAGKRHVLAKRAIERSDIPDKALELIMANFTPSSATSPSEYADERTRQLSARNTASLSIVCALREAELIYTYTYNRDEEALAKDAAFLLDPVYKSQFRTDNEMFSEINAIVLEILLDDGTVVFSKKYNQRVEFGFENSGN